jgi:PIN domain nuclease of toxin-antitoxin system
MRLLLDTNILLALPPGLSSAPAQRIPAAVHSPDNSCFASVVSLWEVAIKRRVKKLDLAGSTAELADFFDTAGIALLPITREHVLAELEAEPGTRDPFDRLLLAVCQVEGMRLVTLDRALAAHPLAWR